MENDAKCGTPQDMPRGQKWNANQLQRLRLALKLSPEQFAERVGEKGFSGRSVRRWESGEHLPSLRHLEAIAATFHYDIRNFFDEDEPAPASLPSPAPAPRGKRPRRPAS